jgi:transcription elongation factor
MDYNFKIGDKVAVKATGQSGIVSSISNSYDKIITSDSVNINEVNLIGIRELRKCFYPEELVKVNEEGLNKKIPDIRFEIKTDSIQKLNSLKTKLEELKKSLSHLLVNADSSSNT